MLKTFLKTVNLCSFTLLLALSVFAVKADELKPEEIIAKHLDSIGSKEKRAAVKNRMAVAKSEFISKVPYGKLGGKALIVSDAGNLFFVSSFNSQNYPFEKIGLFDKKVTIPFIGSGKRSPLGSFLQENNKIISEKLLTGSISNSWAFLDSGTLKAKIDAAGTKKIDGRETFVLNYIPKGVSSSDFSIKLYFDAQTFQHLRTEYQQQLHARNYSIGVLGANSESGTRNLLIEDFRDFKNVDGLTLPHSYKLYLLLDGQDTTYEFEWNLEIAQYLLNQKLESNFFSFNEK
ncbi:MAG TPA: hypothetical protein VK892_00625 [Pyrinomonadaceae bacterium]|nr:hypothetical protein [Pyrinomonadaceae bacterium]